jgi:phage terminase large subunit GpA-like protein
VIAPPSDFRATLRARAARILAPRLLPDPIDWLEGRARDDTGALIPALQIVDKESDYRGPFSTDSCPDLREIVRSCVSPDVETTVQVGPGQGFKTTALLGVMAYTVGVDHGPVGWVMDSTGTCTGFSQKRAQPTIEANALLRALKPANPDDYKTLELSFSTCTVRFLGSNSAGRLASFPYKRVIGDEVDKYPPRIRNEAGALDLLLVRTKAYTHHNHIFASTPTVAWGPIWQAALRGDCRRYHVPCPHCSKSFVQRFTTDGTTLVWDPAAKNPNGTWDLARVARSAHYRCPHCAGEIWENHRRDMLHAGQWIPDPIEIADAARADYQLVADPKCRSYFRSCFNILHPNRTFAAIATQFLLCGRDPSKLQNFWNSDLGEVWEQEGETADADVLYKRREEYLADTDVTPDERRILPDEIRVLTAAVDVQESPARCEYEIVGWGAGLESWGLHYGIVEKHSRTWQETFDEVDRILLQTWILPAGHGGYMELQPAAICWDTGHATEEVYKHVRRCQPRRVYAIKGDSEGYGTPLVHRPKKSGVKAVTLYMIGTVTAKSEIYSRLRLAEPGPGYCHYPQNPKRGYDREYFRQLTAEKAMKRRMGGREVIKFIKPGGRRNEALDIRCYNRAALHLLDPNFDKLTAKIQSATAQLELPVAPGGQPEVRDQPSEISHETQSTDHASPFEGDTGREGLRGHADAGPSGEHHSDALVAANDTGSTFDPATGRIAKADPVVPPPPDSDLSTLNTQPSTPAAPPPVRPNTYELVTGAKPSATPRPNPQRIPRPRRSSWATRW